MEDNTLLSHKEMALSANALCTFYVTPLSSKCVRSTYSHVLAKPERFVDYFEIISLCLLMERRKVLVTIILSEVNMSHNIKSVYKPKSTD